MNKEQQKNIEKEIERLMKENVPLDINFQNVVTHFHTHGELCKKEEIVYREEIVMLLVKKFWENGYTKGFTNGVEGRY